MKGSTRTHSWKATLSNPVAPVSVFLSDDGQHVVTLDNWGRVGYGDDVVALYDSSGQTGNYSLEEFAPPPQTRTNGLIERVKEKIETLRRGASISTMLAYHDLFSHSTSSRWWTEDAIHFFAPTTNSAFFCLWLDWDQRWVAWKLSNGKLVEPNKQQILAWNAEGRRKSLHSIASGAADSAAYNFLGRLRTQEDRSLIEQCLADADFFTGATQTSSSEEDVRYELTSYSQRREKADQILTRWDGGTPSRSRSSETYTHLGSVKGALALPRSPEKSDGFLRVHLIREGTVQVSAVPEAYLVADLQWSRPTSFSGGRVTDLPLGTTIAFAIHGVTPGRYQVHAMWDKEAPRCPSTNRLCQPTRGDFIATNHPSVEVHKGEASPRITVECITLVK
jgi:hypothetical protein